MANIVNMFPGGAASAEWPASIVAGSDIVYGNVVTVQGPASTAYTNFGAGYGFMAKKAGTYRVTYSVLWSGASKWSAYLQLVKNGNAVPGSEVTSYQATGEVTKIVDVALAAGDVLALQSRTGALSTYVSAGRFYVQINNGSGVIASLISGLMEVV